MSFVDIINALGGPAEYGRAIGITSERATGMRARNSIPLEYWPATIEAAQREGIQLTADDLVRIGIEQSCRLPKRSAQGDAR